MSNYRELLQQCKTCIENLKVPKDELQALFQIKSGGHLIEKIEEELAKPDIKPVAWIGKSGNGLTHCSNDFDEVDTWVKSWGYKDGSIEPLYAPPQQKPLSRKVILQIIEGGESLDEFTLLDFAREIEKAHGIGV